MSPKKKFDADAMATELSESAFFQPPTSTQVGKTTSTQADKPTKLPKYTTHLKAETIKAIKVYAAAHDMKDYEVAQLAFDQFLTANTTE